MNLIEHVKEIEKKYEAGQEIFRRSSVRFLLERISQLEQAAKQSKPQTDDICPADGGKHSWHPNKDNYLAYSCRKCGKKAAQREQPARERR